MKKAIIFSTFFFIFVLQLTAQLTTNRWYGSSWGWVVPASNDYSSELYRNGSFSIVEPCCGDASTMQGKGYLFFDGQNKHPEWDSPNFGLSMGNFSKFNVAQSDTYNWNNLGVVLSGWAGLGLRTQFGALMMHQNGIISMGFSQNGRDFSKIRELSQKTPEFVSSTTTGFTLYVRNGIVTDKIKVALVTNWPDYVFKKDYKLLPLAEIETFIATNGHLPNTLSAEVIENQGLELGTTAKNHQEKIEELYLHLIALEKSVKELQLENLKLKQQLAKQ